MNIIIPSSWYAYKKIVSLIVHSKLDLKTLKDCWARARHIIIRVSSRSIYSQSFIRIDEFGSVTVFSCKFAPHFAFVDGYRIGLDFYSKRVRDTF